MAEKKVFVVQVKHGDKCSAIEIETCTSSEESDYRQIVTRLKDRRPTYSQFLDFGHFDIKVQSSFFPDQLLDVTENSPIKNQSRIFINIKDTQKKTATSRGSFCYSMSYIH